MENWNSFGQNFLLSIGIKWQYMDYPSCFSVFGGIFCFLQFTLCWRRISTAPVTFWCTSWKIISQIRHSEVWSNLLLQLIVLIYFLFALFQAFILLAVWKVGPLSLSERILEPASCSFTWNPAWNHQHGHRSSKVSSLAHDWKWPRVLSRELGAPPGKWIMVYHLFWNRLS